MRRLIIAAMLLFAGKVLADGLIILLSDKADATTETEVTTKLRNGSGYDDSRDIVWTNRSKVMLIANTNQKAYRLIINGDNLQKFKANIDTTNGPLTAMTWATNNPNVNAAYLRVYSYTGSDWMAALIANGVTNQPVVWE